jgi:4-amino-4-deoxy-L-arabinose transferase-like glycosyltransferase
VIGELTAGSVELAADPDQSRPGKISKPARAAVGVALIFALLLFQFADTSWLSLRVWDESRLAVNALEMRLSGHWLATTYGFQPDFWNTKPPFAVNLMALSIGLFGPTNFAVRVPSAAATCMTVILVFGLARYVTRSSLWGIFAAVLLATSELAFGEHGGQTGDYDSILTLLTTAYASALFLMLDQTDRRRRWTLGVGILFGLAILTKSIAGVIPGVGLAAYVLFCRPAALRTHFWLFFAVVTIGLGMAAAYYLLHEAYTPGYLQAVLRYDLSGRFSGAIEDHGGPWSAYLDPLWWRSPVRFFPLLAGIALLPQGRARQLGIFALTEALVIVAIYSSAATKLHWYIIPAVPFLSIALAMGALGWMLLARRGAGFVPPAVTTRAGYAVVALILIYVSAHAVLVRYVRPTPPMQPPPAFDRLIAAHHMLAPAASLVVVDTGVNSPGDRYYAPTLRFYLLAAAMRGARVTSARSLAQASSNDFMGSCDPRTMSQVASSGKVVWRQEGCVLVSRQTTG